MPEISGVVCFTDEVIATISAALLSASPPERVALLPELLHAWAREDLREHLFREGRAVIRYRSKQLAAVSETARILLQTVQALDGIGRFQIACAPQMRREARMGNSRWGRTGLRFLGPDDIGEAERRRDEALSWLCDLIEAIAEPSPKPPPDRKTRGYLMVLDLAAIFELVTRTKPTRRNNASADSQPYGPFWDFARAVWSAVHNTDRGLQSAIRTWADEVNRQTALAKRKLSDAERVLGRPLDGAQDKDLIEGIMRRCGSYSPFAANLQFRHPDLWQKLRRPPTEICP